MNSTTSDSRANRQDADDATGSETGSRKQRNPVSRGARWLWWRLHDLRNAAEISWLRATLPSKRNVRAIPHPLPSELVVSLTSYRGRFNVLPLTLRCLMNQTIRPDRLVLWVSHEDEPHLPDTIRRLVENGLEVRPTKDLRSFKKIIPTLQAFPDAFVVTADDDAYYGPRWLEELVGAWDGRDRLVVCHQARRVATNAGKLQSYALWKYLDEPREGPDVFPVGVGGVLYPPRSLPEKVLDEELFMEICPKADDVWLYWMGRTAGVTYKKIGSARPPLNWIGSQGTALWSDNLLSGANDRQIRALGERLGFPDFDAQRSQ